MSLYQRMTPAEIAEIASWAKAASNGFIGDPKTMGALMFKCLRHIRIQDAQISGYQAKEYVEREAA